MNKVTTKNMNKEGINNQSLENKKRILILIQKIKQKRKRRKSTSLHKRKRNNKYRKALLKMKIK